jgi:hypothetical protein
VHSLEPEIRELRQEGLVDDATASRVAALERGDVFSVHAELRVALYAGVTMVTGGVGMILARNLDRIGPLAITLAIALAAAACVIPALRAIRAGNQPSTAADYLLLLGALLASADLAYAERQFGLLGPLWPWHLLLLAGLHAALAYAFRSSLVLGASLAALAGWFGVGGGFGEISWAGTSAEELGTRALACAATIFLWRFADRQRDPDSPFSTVFDHFGANLAFWGALAWCHPMPWLLLGLPVLGVLATAAVRHALATGHELFLVYGVVYAALGICIAVASRLDDEQAAAGFSLLVVCVAAATLWHLRQRIREGAEP